MTTGPQHNQGPPDSDRIFPDMFSEPLDPEAAAFLAENDWEGVPIPYGFQQVQKIGDWLGRLAEEGPSDSLMEEINAGLAEPENKYPGAPMWDRQRGLLADSFLAAGHSELAMDFLQGMHSPHQMAENAISLAAKYTEGGGDGSAWVNGFAYRLHESQDQANYLGFVRALADHTIDEDPDAPEIDSFESVLAQYDPDFDPVQSWADSQRLLDPKVDWDGIVDIIKDDERWTGVPINVRRFAMKLNRDMLKAMNEEPGPEQARRMLDSLNDAESAYPEANIWDVFRHSLADLLIAKSQPVLAREFGCAIKDAHIQHNLVADLYNQDFESDAFELATNVRDPKVKANLLLSNEGWPDGAGLKLLAEK